MKSQILHAWQPNELIKFTMDEHLFYHIGLVDVQLGPKALTITLESKSKILQIIYDQVAGPIPYYVWNFRYGNELSDRNDLPYANEAIYPDTLNKESYHFFRVQNSEFIEWNDRVSPFKSKDYPELEHHLFFTSDDFLEILSLYEPKIIVTDK